MPIEDLAPALPTPSRSRIVVSMATDSRSAADRDTQPAQAGGTAVQPTRRLAIKVRNERSGPHTGPQLQFPGADREVWAGGERTVVAPWLLDGVRLTDLRHAGIRAFAIAEWEGGQFDATDDEGIVLRVVEANGADFWELVDDDEYPIFSTVEIRAGRSGVRVVVTPATALAASRDQVESVATAAADRVGGRVIAIAEAYRTASTIGWDIEVTLRRRAATAEELLRLGERVDSAVGLTADGLDREAVAAVIRAGFPDVLVGARENAWLEAKSRPWDLESGYGKVELAQDVARFANADGGLIVVGARTAKRGEHDIVVGADGIAPSTFSTRRARAVIDGRVYPPVAGLGLSVDAIAGSSNVIASITVPRQDERLKPFVVHGAVIGRKVDGAFISVVVRRGEESIVLTAPELQTWLAAGRRLLREGQLGRRRRSGRSNA